VNNMEKTMTLVEHLEDLRRVLLKSVYAIIISTVIIYGFFREQLFNLIIIPVTQLGLPLIATAATEAFITKLKVSAMAGLIVSLPWIILQVWGFILPALYPKERRYLYILVPASIILFAGGALFAYFTVLPIAIRFLLITSAEGVAVMLTVSRYLGFLISFLLPFGIVFQMPLVVFFLTRTGVIEATSLARYRRLAILLIFVVAAILTPPDVISQLLLAGPMLLLYEISILIARVFRRRETEAVITEEITDCNQPGD